VHLVLPLRRKSELESSVAPHKVIVLATEDKASIEVLPLQDVHLESPLCLPRCCELLVESLRYTLP